jgi:hypothetical protein
MGFILSMFYDKDNVFISLLIGLALPIIAYATLLVGMETYDTYGGMTQIKLVEAIKPRTLQIVSLCINVFMMRWYQRKRYDNSMRGIFIAIGIYAVIWIVKNGSEIFSSL